MQKTEPRPYNLGSQSVEKRPARGRSNLSGAKNIDSAIVSIGTAFFALQCPEKGAYTAYKKLSSGFIAELEIPADAMRSSATSRKCRASKAYVVSITDVDGNHPVSKASSKRDPSFIYEVGKMVEVPDFDLDRWNDNSTGIHHYITRAEAVAHQEKAPLPGGQSRKAARWEPGSGLAGLPRRV